MSGLYREENPCLSSETSAPVGDGENGLGSIVAVFFPFSLKAPMTGQVWAYRGFSVPLGVFLYEVFIVELNNPIPILRL